MLLHMHFVGRPACAASVELHFRRGCEAAAQMAKKSLFIGNGWSTENHRSTARQTKRKRETERWGDGESAWQTGHIEINANCCQDIRPAETININFNMTKNIFAHKNAGRPHNQRKPTNGSSSQVSMRNYNTHRSIKQQLNEKAYP